MFWFFFFFDALGGFLTETILASFRCQSIATASSSLAATLLTRRGTTHSTLKVPLNLTQTELSVCCTKKETALARLIQDCSAIINDETPLSNKIVFEALDRTSRHCSFNVQDFRQALPVIRCGTRANVVNAYSRSPLCDQMKKRI